MKAGDIVSKPKVKVQLIDENGKVIKEEESDFLIGRMVNMENKSISGFSIMGASISPLDLVISAYLIMDELYNCLLKEAEENIPSIPGKAVDQLFNYVGFELDKGIYMPQAIFEKVTGAMEEQEDFKEVMENLINRLKDNANGQQH